MIHYISRTHISYIYIYTCYIHIYIYTIYTIYTSWSPCHNFYRTDAVCQVFEDFRVFASDYVAFVHACDRCRLVNWKWVECTYGILDQDQTWPNKKAKLTTCLRSTRAAGSRMMLDADLNRCCFWICSCSNVALSCQKATQTPNVASTWRHRARAGLSTSAGRSTLDWVPGHKKHNTCATGDWHYNPRYPKIFGILRIPVISTDATLRQGTSLRLALVTCGAPLMCPWSHRSSLVRVKVRLPSGDQISHIKPW